MSMLCLDLIIQKEKSILVHILLLYKDTTVSPEISSKLFAELLTSSRG